MQKGTLMERMQGHLRTGLHEFTHWLYDPASWGRKCYRLKYRWLHPHLIPAWLLEKRCDRYDRRLDAEAEQIVEDIVGSLGDMPLINEKIDILPDDEDFLYRVRELVAKKQEEFMSCSGVQKVPKSCRCWCTGCQEHCSKHLGGRRPEAVELDDETEAKSREILATLVKVDRTARDKLMTSREEAIEELIWEMSEGCCGRRTAEERVETLLEAVAAQVEELPAWCDPSEAAFVIRTGKEPESVKRQQGR